MGGRGRYGKYGELKRKAKLRQSRLLLAGHGGIFLPPESSRQPKPRKTGNKK
jgi:hypothetical protein